MKEKLNNLKENYKEIASLTKQIIKLTPEVNQKFNELDTNGLYKKEETLDNAINYYINETTEQQKELIDAYKNDKPLFVDKMIIIAQNNSQKSEVIKKLMAYSDCGVVDLANMYVDLEESIAYNQYYINEIKKDVKNEPHVNAILNKVDNAAMIAYGLVMPYAEVASEQKKIIEEIATEYYIEKKEKALEQIKDGAKKLSKKLEDFANKNNKE